MKTKDIVIVSVCGTVLLIAGYFMYTMMFPSTPATTTKTSTSTATTEKKITGQIDSDTLDKLKAYKDYGGSTLDDIGRVNPFGSLN